MKHPDCLANCVGVAVVLASVTLAAPAAANPANSSVGFTPIGKSDAKRSTPPSASSSVSLNFHPSSPKTTAAAAGDRRLSDRIAKTDPADSSRRAKLPRFEPPSRPGDRRGATPEPTAASPKPATSPPTATKPPVPEAPTPAPDATADSVAKIPEDWWGMGSDSPLAIALGNAEGTRRPDGGKNPAYYWHVDPGNGANNFGTFSWQHLPNAAMAPVKRAPTTAEKRRVAKELGLPERSDRAGLARLREFEVQLRQQAIDKGMSLTLRELIEGLDLSNQAPLAGLNDMGYLDRLKQMRELLDDPQEQVLEARVWSYWHPQRNTWDAPGLGNTYARIRHDQQRRQTAIGRALAHESTVSAAPPNPKAQAMSSRQVPPPSPSKPPSESPAEAVTIAQLMEERPIPCALCGF